MSFGVLNSEFVIVSCFVDYTVGSPFHLYPDRGIK
jgi:hypothetical protein